MMGGGSGVILMALGFFSMNTWKNGGSSTPMTVLSMGTYTRRIRLSPNASHMSHPHWSAARTMNSRACGCVYVAPPPLRDVSTAPHRVGVSCYRRC